MDTYQDTTKEYLYTFILGNKDILDSNRKKIYQQNGISHLFSISGMHISLFTMVLFKFIKKLSYNIRFQHYFVILVLFLYMLIVEISPSIVRTVLMFTCFSFNKIYRLHYKKENLLLCIFIIMMLVNPFYLYNVGFWLSYLISSILVLQSSKLSQCKNYFVKALMISWISFLISFPIVIYNYCEVNFFSIILNLIVVPFVSIIIFPLSLFTFLFPFLEGTFLFFVSILERLSIFVSHFPTTFVFKKMSFIFLIFYYIVIAAIFYNKKFFILFILMLLIHKNITYFDSSGMVSIMDVGQGDCIFIRLPYNQGNILIDTGGVFLYKKESWQEKENEYHLMENTIIPYLKALGVEKLQYLILTHGDYDHMGEAIHLVENFKVEKVIFNCGEFNELEQELIQVLNGKKIPYYSCIKELNINDNKLYFLKIRDYGNENDNSNVIYTKFNNYKFLFMGDASVGVEEDLIEKYNLQDIDVLKVGHHGSKTSSSKEFINEINPKYSIISVGNNNRYGHPNDSVLDNLDDSKIYRTDEDGSIMFKIKNSELKIETCAP